MLVIKKLSWLKILYLFFLIMIKIQGIGTALLLLVNPCIPLHHMPHSYQLSSEKKTLHLSPYCRLCSTHYAAMLLFNLKRTSAIKVVTMKLHTISVTNGSLPQNRHLVVSKDEWDAKEGTGKNALYEQQCPKRHLLGWSNVKSEKSN